MKTIFIDLTNQFPLSTSGNNIVYKQDLMNDIIYEIGAELAFLIKEKGLSDKSKIITDFETNQPGEYLSLYESIKNNIYNELLKKGIIEEIKFRFPESYIDWLYYNSSPIYSSIGKVLKEKKGIVTISSSDIYDEYITTHLLNRLKRDLEDKDIQKFTIVDLDDKETKIVKDIEKLRENLQYEDFTGSWVQCEIGYAFCEGIGVPQDKAKSIPFYIQAANKNNSIASNWLGWCYQNGIGVWLDSNKAFYYYTKAAELGNINGKANLGFCYHTGLGTEIDYKKAEELYKECIDAIPFTQTNLANIYYYGYLGYFNYEEALRLYKKRSDTDGDAFSSFQTGYMYQNGLGVEKNLDNALSYFLKAEKAGNKDSYINIGDLILQGNAKEEFTPKDAYSYYDKALEHGIENKEIVIRIKEKILRGEYENNKDIKDITISDRVMEIPENAFKNCENLKTVKIPSSVRIIKNNAFYGCSSLEQVIFENGVEEIEDNVFYGCTSLRSIRLPDSIKSIGNSAFENCESLIEFKLGESVSDIGESAFKNCSSLGEIQLPNSVEELGESCFENCRDLKTVHLNENIELLPENLFLNCISLARINIPFNIKEIGGCAFANCERLNDIIFPNKPYSEETEIEINWEVFKGCKSLTNIDLGNCVTKISSSAFEECISLKEITLPPYILSLGGAVFKDCLSLERINLPESAPIYNKIKKDFNSNEIRYDTYGHLPKDSFPGIGRYLFQNCKSLKSISIPSHFIWGSGIGDFAFEGCNALKEVIVEDVPEDIIRWFNKHLSCYHHINDGTLFKNRSGQMFAKSFLGQGIFKNCKNLNKIEFGNFLWGIGARNEEPLEKFDYIINNCPSLTYLKFPSITSENLEAGYSWQNSNVDYSSRFICECPNLTEIDFSNWYWLINKDELNCKGGGLFLLPESFYTAYNVGIDLLKSLMENLPLQKILVNQNFYEDVLNLTNIIYPQNINKLERREKELEEKKSLIRNSISEKLEESEETLQFLKKFSRILIIKQTTPTDGVIAKNNNRDNSEQQTLEPEEKPINNQKRQPKPKQSEIVPQPTKKSTKANKKNTYSKTSTKSKNDSIFNSKETEELKGKIKKGLKGWMSKLSDMIDDI